MSRVRKIYLSDKNYFIVDSCFLADKYIPLVCIEDNQKKNMIRNSHSWWREIDNLVKNEKSRIYIPDICIAETFKVLAKEYSKNSKFDYARYKTAREKLRSDIRIPPTDLAKQGRKIKIHDLPTSRDIIISIDRFYQICFNNDLEKISIPDLIIIGSAKYLIDFYDLPRERLHIISSDEDLVKGCKKTTEIPYAYNPRKTDPSSVFCAQKKNKPAKKN